MSQEQDPGVQPQTVREKILEDIMQERQHRIEGPRELTRDLPEILQAIIFDPGLGHWGRTDPEWKLICEAADELGQFIRLMWDILPPHRRQAYMELTKRKHPAPTQDDIYYTLLQTEFNLFLGMLKTRIWAYLPKTKRKEIFELESLEKREVLQPEPLKEGTGGRTSTKMRRALERQQYVDEEE